MRITVIFGHIITITAAFWVILHTVPVYAQTNRVDSLHALLRAAQNATQNTLQDSVVVTILNDLAFDYRYRAPDSILAYAQQAGELAERIGYSKGLARALTLVGYAYNQQGRYDLSFERYSSALQISTELADKNGIASAQNFIGNLHKRLGKYNDALEAYFKALQICEQLGQRNRYALALSNIGEIYDLQGKYDNALDALFRALNIFQQTGHNDIILVLHGLGQVYQHQGKYDQALEYYFKTVEAKGKTEYRRYIAAALYNIGYIYAKRGKFDSAIEYARNGLKAAQELGSQYELYNAYKALADTYTELHKSAEALQYYRRYSELKDSLLSDQQQSNIAHLQEKVATATNEKEIQLLKRDREAQAVVRNSFIAGFVLVSAVALLAFNRYRLKRRSEALLQQQNNEIKQQRDKLEEQSTAIASANDELQYANHALYIKNNELAQSVTQIQTLNNVLAKTNRRLNEINSEKNELLGIVAHDLKNPLSSVIFSTEMIRTYGEKMSQEEREHRYRTIVTTAQRMNRIVTNLLDMNAIESGAVKFSIEPFDICEVTQAVVLEYAERAATKNIRIFCEQPSHAVLVTADKNFTREILDNLVSNAVKYSPLSTSIWLRVTEPMAETLVGQTSQQKVQPTGGNGLFTRKNDAPMTRIEVQDEGPGISHDDQKKLFNKFARLSAKPTGGEDSTGLGLSIVKKLTESMHGKVWCESNPESGSLGATFIVNLPAHIQMENSLTSVHSD